MIANDAIRRLQAQGFCVLKDHFPGALIENCRRAFWPVLMAHVGAHEPNRGPHRHFLPMPFDPPSFAPEFFFDPKILSIVRGTMGDRVVADQWGCDVPLQFSEYQQVHVDYRRPLFEEAPHLQLPPYMLVVSFGLVPIGADNGAIEIAPGTHVAQPAAIPLQPVPLEIGDVLIRHPWALHRGTPNTTTEPRPLVSIRYVRRWYTDDSREVSAIPRAVWAALTPEQQSMMRFPLVE